MKLFNLRTLMLAGLALPIGFATATLAADHDGPGAAPSHEGMRHMDDPAAQAAHAERHAQHLRDALQLRPEQEPALKALLESMKPPGGMMEHMQHEHDEGENLTTPQRLDKMLAHLDEARAHMAAHSEAVKRFYAQLSPAQQKAFDAMGPMGGMHMRMMMHMGGGHGGMGGMGGMAMGGMPGMDGDDMDGGERRVIIMRGGPDGAPPPPPHN